MRLVAKFVARWCGRRGLLTIPVDTVHDLAYHSGAAVLEVVHERSPGKGPPPEACVEAVAATLKDFGIPPRSDWDGWHSDA